MKFKIITIFLFLIASFFFGYLVSADTIDLNYTDGVNSLSPNISQSFIPNVDNLSKLVIIGSAGDFYCNAGATLNICSGTLPTGTGVGTPSLTCSGAGQALIGTTSNAFQTGSSTSFSPALSLTPSGNYFFSITGTCQSIKAKNVSGFRICYSNGTCEADVFRLAFQTYYSTAPPAPQFTINLITPSPSAPLTTYYDQPDNYSFEYLNPLNWYPQIRFMVKRRADTLASAWPDYINSATFWTNTEASTTLTIDTQSFKLPDGYYDLDVYFWANTPVSPVHATTTFTINTGGDYGGYSFSTTTLIRPPTFSTDDLCDGIATSTTFGAIECGFKKALVGAIEWAFSPSFDTLTNFKVSFELFKGCFPFNTYFQLTDTINDAVVSTATTTAGTVKIPFIDKTGDIYMLDMISSSTLVNWIGQDNYNLFRTTLGYFLWLIAVAVVFFTVKFI